MKKGEEQNRRREKSGRNEKLGVGRYQREDNFVLFFNLRNEKGRRNGEFDVHFDPLGSPGTPLVDLNEKAWNQTLTHLRLPGLKIGN